MSKCSPQEKQTKVDLTRKQQKGKKKGAQEEESQDATELLKRPREYTVKFTFPNPPPLSPPILGLHCESPLHHPPPTTQPEQPDTRLKDPTRLPFIHSYILRMSKI